MSTTPWLNAQTIRVSSCLVIRTLLLLCVIRILLRTFCKCNHGANGLRIRRSRVLTYTWYAGLPFLSLTLTTLSATSLITWWTPLLNSMSVSLISIVSGLWMIRMFTLNTALCVLLSWLTPVRRSRCPSMNLLSVKRSLKSKNSSTFMVCYIYLSLFVAILCLHTMIRWCRCSTYCYSHQRYHHFCNQHA